MLLLGAALVVPVQADLLITPTFDSSVTSTVKTTINQAISFFESTYTNNIDVDIYFQASNSGLGSSNFAFYNEDYQTFYNDLKTTDANPAAIAGLTAANNGNSTDNPVTGSSQIYIKSADARAVGINVQPGCDPTGSAGSMVCAAFGGPGPGAVDGIITLNTSLTYPPSSNNGSNYGLLAVVEHEMDEILGLGSSLPNTDASSGTVSFLDGMPAPEDLFRYSSVGTLGGAVNCSNPGSVYLSYTGVTPLVYLNNACNGADFGDWVTGTSPQVQDAFGEPGTNPAYGPSEIDAMTAIGYTLAPVPEPATWILFLVPMAALAFARRRFGVPRYTEFK